MVRSQLGDYVCEALISAKKQLEDGNLEAADRYRLNLKSHLEDLGVTGLHLIAIDWGPWREVRDLENYEHVHDSNRPEGDPRECWVTHLHDKYY